jgi:hypothetical protein
MTTSTNDTVKFVDDGLSEMGHKPVEPELLSLFARQRLDDLLSRPSPTVLRALSMHNTGLYDLGTRAGMDWARRSAHDVKNWRNNPEYKQYVKMYDLLRTARPHTADCYNLAYVEGWINGWASINSGVMP